MSDDLTPEGRLLTELEVAAGLNHDPEVAHLEVDRALLDYVESKTSTGQAHCIRQAFDNVKKWYA